MQRDSLQIFVFRLRVTTHLVEDLGAHEMYGCAAGKNRNGLVGCGQCLVVAIQNKENTGRVGPLIERSGAILSRWTGRQGRGCAINLRAENQVLGLRPPAHEDGGDFVQVNRSPIPAIAEVLKLDRTEAIVTADGKNDGVDVVLLRFLLPNSGIRRSFTQPMLQLDALFSEKRVAHVDIVTALRAECPCKIVACLLVIEDLSRKLLSLDECDGTLREPPA